MLHESKTTCSDVEKHSFTPRKDILDNTKTSCFAVVTVNDTFPKSITQDDELIAKELNKIVIHL